MARHRRRSSEHPDDAPKPRKRPRPGRRKTDLSAFLAAPLSVIDDIAFDDLCRQMLQQLAPADPGEEQMAGLVLRMYVLVRRAHQEANRGMPGADRLIKMMIRSFHSYERSYDLFRKLQGGGRVASPPPSPCAAPAPAPEPSPLPVTESQPEPEPISSVPIDEPAPDDDPAVAEAEAASGDWRSRIAMVPRRDARWPVLDQLDLVVDDILSLRDRGVPEEEILERFPPLTLDDLAACYACEADGYRGPLEPPYPEDIGVLEYGPE